MTCSLQAWCSVLKHHGYWRLYQLIHNTLKLIEGKWPTYVLFSQMIPFKCLLQKSPIVFGSHGAYESAIGLMQRSVCRSEMKTYIKPTSKYDCHFEVTMIHDNYFLQDTSCLIHKYQDGNRYNTNIWQLILFKTPYSRINTFHHLYHICLMHVVHAIRNLCGQCRTTELYEHRRYYKVSTNNSKRRLYLFTHWINVHTSFGLFTVVKASIHT